MTSVRRIRSLKESEIAQSPQAHLHGVVTYYDSAVPNLFVQDSTGGIWVNLWNAKNPPPKPGQLLDLRGVVARGFTPFIAQPKWTVIGKAALPTPLHLTYEQAATGSFDSQWAEMEGVVRSFFQEQKGGILVMDVAAPTGSFKVLVPDYHAGLPFQLIDAKVRLRGVCGSTFNARNQLVALHLQMPSMDDLQVLQPAPPNPFAQPTSPVNSIRRFSADLPDVHRVKLKGVVTAQFPGRGLFLADSSGGVYVETQDSTPVEPGDEVEVIGFPAAGEYSPVLKSGTIRRTGKHSKILPVNLTGRAALRGGYDAQLVTITGMIHSEHPRSNGLIFDVESNDHVSFEASLRDLSDKTFDVPRGSMATFTGVCAIKPDETGYPAEFRVVLRSPADVNVISSPPWLTTRRGVYLLCGLVVITLAVIGWVVVLRRRVSQQTQIIKRKLEAEAALEKRYRRVFERNTAGLYIAHEKGGLIDCNEACARILGFSSREDVFEHAQLAENIVKQFCGSPGAEDSIVNAEHRFQRWDGSWAWALSNARLVRGGTGQAVIEGTLVDITDRKVADERIQFLAYYDSLTGLPNRTLLQDRLSKAIAGARRRKEKVAVLFLDIDRFKYINDSLGHSHGDLLLQKVARRLEVCARDQDTVARLGGDEFLIVLNAIEKTSDAGMVAERVCREIATGFEILGQLLSVSCSIGISMFPEHGKDAETLIKNADAAMYSSKECGRNTFRFFTEEMTARSLERLTLENALRSSLEKEQLYLLYQPEVDLTSGEMVCCEALLRWQHPTLGLIPPDRFIEVAEGAGLIIHIGEWVLRTACAQAKQWQNEGLIAIPVAVNVSAVQFRQEGFCSLVKRVLEETGLAPQYLELELTETVLLAHEDLTFQVLGELRSLGVSLALDDFGTGYSSLSYLKQFPVNKLKIDRAFICDIAENSSDATIAAAIVNMARCLNMRVTAEGVESEEQLSLLRRLGCNEVQGFYTSEPLSVDRMRARIRAHAQWFTVQNEDGSTATNWPWTPAREPLPSEAR